LIQKKQIKNNFNSNSSSNLAHDFHLRINTSFEKRQEYLDGKPHTVTEATMIIGDTVLCGNAGCFHYSSGAIARSVNAWDGKPVTLGHPEKDNTPVSVNSSTDIYNNFVVGQIFNTSFVNNELKAELWLNDSKCQDIYKMMDQGYSIDVSTGMFSKDSLNYNGNVVQGSITEIYPDHLALLPGGQGACSLEDGCGIRARDGEPPKRFTKGSNDFNGQIPVFNQYTNTPPPLPDPDSFSDTYNEPFPGDEDTNNDVPTLPNVDFED